MRLTATTIAMIGGLAVTAQGAPLGVPAATAGAGKTMLGGEINVVMDRDLTGTGNAEAESSQFFAKGTLGIDDRLDLDFRLGFGDFQVDAVNLDSDLGPAFGVSMRLAGPRDPKQRSTQFGLIPYGGFAWSGLDLDTLGAVEDDAFGIF